MVQTCAIRGCKSNSRKTENIHFFQFPSEKNLAIRKQWIQNTGRVNPDGAPWEAKYFHKVCSKHFKDGRPTPQNPVPDLELVQEEPPQPRRGRPARSHSSPVPSGSTGRSTPGTPKSTPATSDSDSVKESVKDADSASVKMDVNEDSNSSTPSQTQRGTASAKGSDDKSSPADAVPPRSSGRKRKKKVMPDTLSDEEVIDQVIDTEPETFVIWRSRATAPPSETTPESSAPSGMKSMRMRPRRVPSTPQPVEEPEPELPQPPSKRKRLIMITDDGEEEEKDAFCWMCHKDGADLGCELCPRGFHLRCLDINQACPSWVCPECEKVMRAECVDTRSPAMSLLTIDQLCVILRFTCSQMRITGSEPFSQPVDPVALPLYADFIANPIDFATLERNIRRRMYGSTEAFVADVRWILHNSIVFNGSANNKLTGMARAIVRICKQEISDIEGCPDCYSNAWIKQDRNWFVKPCRIPHTLVWAKLKGYPFWPGKAIVEDSGQTDVRFFGAHDRAWVPTTNVFLLSREPPVEMKNRRIGLEEAMDELNIHIKKLKEKFGSFKYAAPNVPYEPNATYSHIDRLAGGELKSDIKKELGVPVKPETKTETDTQTKSSPDKTMATRGSRRLSKEGAESASTSEEASSNADNLERAETPMEDSKSEILGTDLPLTPSKRPQTKGANDGIAPKVDLSSVQKKDSRGVFEVSDEALGPDVTSLQRKKVKEERIIRTRASDKSIVDRLQQKIQEAEKALAKGEGSVSEESTASTTNSTAAEDEKFTSPKLLPEDASKTPTRKSSTSPIAKSVASSGEQELSPPVLVPEMEPCGSAEGEDKTDTTDSTAQSFVGSPKKNPLLANLVESCKAQLGITNQEELKEKMSPGVEMEEEDVTTSSSSPQTVASSAKSPVNAEDDDDDEEDDEDEDEEEDDDDDDDEDDEENEDEEDEDEEDTEMEVDEDKAEKNEAEEEQSKAKDASLDNQKDEPAQPREVSSKDEEDTTAKDEKSDTVSEEPMAVDNEDTVSKPAKDARRKPEENISDKSNKSEAIVEKSVTDQIDKLPDKQEKTLQHMKSESLSPEKPFPSRLLEELSKPCPKSSDTKANLDEMLSPPQTSSLEAALLAPRASREGTPKLNQTPGHDLQHLQQPNEKALSRENAQTSKLSLDSTQKTVTDTENTENKDLVSSNEVKVGNAANQPKSETADLVSRAMAELKEDTPTSDSMSSQDDKTSQYKASKGSARQEGRQPEDSVFNVEKYVEKAMKGVQSVFHDMFDDFISSDMGHKTSKHLKAELLRTKWHYDQALVEQQHNTDLMMAEMRMVLEHEQNVRIKKLIRLHEEERERTIEEVKRKQWCANCRKEAMFYCCWNTSYCDYPCQQKHWTKHMSHCTQTSQTQTSLTPHDMGQSVMSIDSLTTPIQHAAPSRNTDQVSRPETRGTKRPASDTIRAMPVNTPTGVQYLPSQSVPASSVKLTSSVTVSKAMKIAGAGSGMAVQYLTSPLGGPTLPSPVALQQLITNQGTTTTTPGGPIMYQVVPQQQMSNIRIIQPGSATVTPTTAPPPYTSAPPPYSPPAEQPVTGVSLQQ